MQYPVVDLRRGLMFAKDASQKHVRIGLFGKVGNFGNSGGNGIGASEKLPSRRSTEGTPLEKFVLQRTPQLRVRQRCVAMPSRCLQ